MRINYARIAAAEAHYAKLGYSEIDAPWIIAVEAYSATRPPTARAFETLGGYLVASAEQSFLHLMLGGADPRLAFATTPCFRDETYDELHMPYFFKVELIDSRQPNLASVWSLIKDARAFFEQFVATEVVQTSNVAWDINEAKTHIELGSYGLRRHGDLLWAYGTGLAEPRLSQAITKSRR